MKKYPEYKDSEIEWLGKIPKHWTITPFKHIISFINGYAFKSDTYTEDGIPIIRIGDVQKSINFIETKKVPKEYWDELPEMRIYYGDILIALTGATIGKSSTYQYHNPALLNQRVALIRPKSNCVPSFVKYLIQMNIFREYILVECNGGAQGNIGKEEIGNFSFQLPPTQEQLHISTYLDKKTNQIDALIGKKREMIELLKEERAAIINQAVTKGINPDAEMKDSGIEWLGEVPKHWEIKKLKYFVGAILGGGTPSKNTPEYWIGEIPWVSPKDMKSDLISDSIDKISHKAISESSTSLIPKNSVLIVVRSGILKHTIPVALNTVEVTLNQDMKAVIPKKCLKSEYLFFIIKGMQNELLTFTTKIGATVDSIEYEYLINFSITLPPLQEQERILSYIQKETHKIDNLISLAEREIMLFEEYRTALINEAVTGKIDIRTNNEANHV